MLVYSIALEHQHPNQCPGPGPKSWIKDQQSIINQGPAAVSKFLEDQPGRPSWNSGLPSAGRPPCLLILQSPAAVPVCTSSTWIPVQTQCHCPHPKFPVCTSSSQTTSLPGSCHLVSSSPSPKTIHSLFLFSLFYSHSTITVSEILHLIFFPLCFS